MLHCVVSVSAEDGKTYEVQTDATSLFAAAYEGIRNWSLLWWYSPNLIIEVKAGDKSWKVRASRVSDWNTRKR